MIWHCELVVYSRGAGIRTRDLLNPIQARYQAAPHPEISRDIATKCSGEAALSLCVGEHSSRLVAEACRSNRWSRYRRAVLGWVASGFVAPIGMRGITTLSVLPLAPAL